MYDIVGMDIVERLTEEVCWLARAFDPARIACLLAYLRAPDMASETCCT